MADNYVKIVRNTRPIPFLQNEGIFIKPVPHPPTMASGENWHQGLSPHDRLFYHQTLSSVRSSKRYRVTPQIPRDSLDFALQSRYNHSCESFSAPVDQVMQHETCALHPNATFRQLRNTRMRQLVENEYAALPLRIGGVKEKISAHSVKLINSGPHTQFVNNGFSRQSSDGNCFRY